MAKHDHDRRQKVFCLGLGHTGTSTFHAAMQQLGFSSRGFSPWLVRSYDRFNYTALKKTAEAYDAFHGMPWPYLYRQLDRWQPGAYFILTRRQSFEDWYQSLCEEYDRTGPTRTRKMAYGFANPYGHEQKLRILHDLLNHQIRTYFKGNPRFLEVCWEEGDGWDELCGLLELEKPASPFPYETEPAVASGNRFRQTRQRLKQAILG